MPKRVIDFDAMWGSDKLAACAAWAQAEYAWLYGLADASGCFEVTNLRVIWGRVAAIRASLTIERLEQVFAEFQDKGLLFVWEHEGKRYAHWTGSDVPGRLPPPSWRMRLEKFAPPVPKQRLAEYMAKFSRGRAALAGAGFRGETREEHFQRQGDLGFENSRLREVKERLEAGQGQDLDWNLNLGGNGERDGRQEKNLNPGQVSVSGAKAVSQSNSQTNLHSNSNANSNTLSGSNANAMSAKEVAVWRELRVGAGPVCGPAPVKAEVLERIRRREAAARAGGKLP